MYLGTTPRKTWKATCCAEGQLHAFRRRVEVERNTKKRRMRKEIINTTRDFGGALKDRGWKVVSP